MSENHGSLRWLVFMRISAFHQNNPTPSDWQISSWFRVVVLVTVYDCMSLCV